MLGYHRDLVLFALSFSSVGFSLRHNFHAACAPMLGYHRDLVPFSPFPL